MYLAQYVLMNQALRGGGLCSTECLSSFTMFSNLHKLQSDEAKKSQIKCESVRLTENIR